MFVSRGHKSRVKLTDCQIHQVLCADFEWRYWTLSERVNAIAKECTLVTSHTKRKAISILELCDGPYQVLAELYLYGKAEVVVCIVRSQVRLRIMVLTFSIDPLSSLVPRWTLLLLCLRGQTCCRSWQPRLTARKASIAIQHTSHPVKLSPCA